MKLGQSLLIKSSLLKDLMQYLRILASSLSMARVKTLAVLKAVFSC